MLKNCIIKNWKIVFNIQWISLSIFIALAAIYYWDKAAHVYFNRSLETINFQSIFSLIMTWLFAFFAVITFVYPLLLLVQIFSIRHEKGNGKKLILLSLLYLLSIASLFSLYSINSSHAIKATCLSLY
ncbi:hypothetical protein EG344_08710 [Chryseobacterium sp. G0162]|uniref:hypothetical protein n=1 Tax=Chryseobacterium sp. G0162 TaxID=2487063 RepID=UPI000F4E1E71|nr:hypothetical protein [Chryseobacterium sp. G0162]AZB08898.1 hypothetical protein EG344_08710 [Chryseobacterium sp. G0162]